MASIFLIIGLSCVSVMGSPFPAELIKVPNPEQNSVTATVTADNGQLATVQAVAVTPNKNNIQISGLSTGLDTAYPQDNITKFETTTETQKAPESYFSRIINDVMAIPIVVLRSVTKLITDAFSPKKPATISSN